MTVSSPAPTLVWTETPTPATVTGVPDLIELLGERIRGARDAAGISQRELADRLHVDTKTVSRWENGRHQAMRRNANRLAEALGVSVEELGGQLPAVTGRAAGADQLEDVVTMFAVRVNAIEERQKHLVEMAETRVEHDKRVDELLDKQNTLLAEQSDLLKAIRALVELPEGTTIQDYLVQTLRNVAVRDAGDQQPPPDQS